MSGWVSRNRSYLVRLLRVVPSPRYISHCLLRSPLHVLAHPFLGSPLPGRLALLACECFVLGTFGSEKWMCTVSLCAWLRRLRRHLIR